MKLNYLKIVAFLLMTTSIAFAQPKGPLKPFINVRGISFHLSKDLEGMQKGELKDLYLERVKVLSSILPYMAITTKPGVSMKELGIPVNEENNKALDKEIETRTNYLKMQEDFLNSMIPYSDKSSIVSAILFYEEMLKKIHLGGDDL